MREEILAGKVVKVSEVGGGGGGGGGEGKTGKNGFCVEGVLGGDREENGNLG